MKYISIGQFSKRTSLSIRALRLYDAEHLLQPSRVDLVTGYRYYTADQIGTGHLIRQLRNCEMPLDRVRIVLQNPQRARTELIAHRSYLEQRLTDHQRMLEGLNTLIAEHTGDLEVNFRSVSAQPIVLIRKTLLWATRHESGEIGRGIAALQVYVRAVDYAGEPFLMYGRELPATDGRTVNEILICGPTRSLYQPQGDIEILELPPTELAYTVHHGSYTTLQATLEWLLGWIADQGFGIVGDVRETFLRHSANSGSVEEYRTELAIPVRGRA